MTQRPLPPNGKSDPAASTEGSETPVPQRKHRRRFWVFIAVLWTLALLGADGVWASARANQSLSQARGNLQAAVEGVLAGDLPKADAALTAAQSEAEAAAGFRSHPSIWIVSHLPWLGDNVTAVEALSKSIFASAQAGRDVVASARQIGWSGSGLPGLSGRPIAQHKLERLAPALQKAGGALTTAAAGLEDVQRGHLIGPVRSAVQGAQTSLSSDALLLKKTTSAAALLPRVLSDGNRYLLIVQNPDEPRGTGGFMGYYGFVDVQRGHLNLTKFFPTDGTLVPPVKSPNPDFQHRWGRFYALQDLRQANFEPDLPTTSNVILQIAKARGWGTFNGIIMVDPVWMQYMLAAAGPVNTPAWPVPITSENVVPILGHQAFFVPDKNGNGNEDESNAVQGAIGRALWSTLQARQLSPAVFAAGIAASTAQRHLQLFMTDPKSEALVETLGAGGSTTLGKNPIYVTWAGLGANKVGYDQVRSLTVSATLDAVGQANVTTTFSDSNNTTVGADSGYYGSGVDVPPGTMLALISVYGPTKIAGTPAVVSSGPTATALQQDLGRPVVTGTIDVAPGKTSTWSTTYEAPGAVTMVGDTHRYELDFLPQPALSSVPLSVTVMLPAGAQVADTSPGAKISGSKLTWAGSPVTAEAFWVTYR